MKKSQVRAFPPGSPEYVVLHAKWQRSRGRAPSAVLTLGKNPRKSLEHAEETAYFPLIGVYLNRGVPPSYKCEACGITGCKLWRIFQSSPPDLRCAPCAAEIDREDSIIGIDANGQHQTDFGNTDQIGMYVPAIPTEDGSTYWGYASFPQLGCEWWKKLPTLPVSVAS